MEKCGKNDENKVEDMELIPISHKEFNEFIKGRGVTGRNNYKLKELKAMFEFRPMITRTQVTVTINDGEKMSTHMILCQKLHYLLVYHTLHYNLLRRSLKILTE